MKWLRFLPLALAPLFLISCSSFSGTLFVPRLFYKISGRLSGLAGSGLVLLDNGSSNLSPGAGATSFTFNGTVAGGGRYDVTVASQPSSPWQTCGVTNGSGVVGAADITNVQITCTTNTYTVGGDVSMLTSAGLVLQNNGSDNLAVPAGSSGFTFNNSVASGAGYNVTILSQPSGQTCAITNGSATVAGANVTNIHLSCVAYYSIGGTISGLTGAGLILQNNGGDNLPVGAGAAGFTFNTPITDGGGYSVAIFSQPSGQTCTVSNGRGAVAGANVRSVQVSCVTYYSIGGMISGLAGAGLVLQDNGGDNLPVNSGATRFTFSTQIASGGNYNVTVLSEPASPSQTCSVANGNGTVTNADITNVQVTCASTFAYVSNQANSISGYLVSADGTLTALPSSPFPGGSNPAGLAADPSGKFLYVANVLGNNVSGYAIAPDGTLSPIPGSPFPAASGAISVAIEPSGKFLYVPNCGADCSGSGNGAIAAFSITPGTGVLVPIPGSPFVAGTFPYDMAFVTPGATGTFAYAANYKSNTVSGFTIQPNGALSAVPGSPFAAGNMPLALAVDQAFNRLYALNTGSSTVSAYNVQVDGSLVQFSTIGTAVFAASTVADANQHLYVAAANGVSGFTTSALPASSIPGSPFAAGRAPNAVRIDPSGEFLYAVNEGSNSVSGYSIDAATGRLTPISGSPFTTGASPYSITFSAPPSTPVTWYLDNVQFSNGDTASGSFTYDSRSNTVSNINIISGSTTYTQLASTFPVQPFEFVFVPNGTLTFGVPEPALVLFPTPLLTKAGGSVSLTGTDGISVEGLICSNACDAVVTSSQSQPGASLSSTPPAH